MDDIYYRGFGIIGFMVSLMLWRIKAFLIQYATPQIMLPLLTAFVIYLFTELYYEVPWNLWKHVFTDFCLFLSVPLYITLFANVFGNIWDYCQYEKKTLTYDIKKMKPDVYLEVWEDIKYYSYVDKKDCMHVHCSDGFDIVDAAEGQHVDASQHG